MHNFEDLFGIIDIEGCWLKIPPQSIETTENVPRFSDLMTLIVTEVSVIVIKNMKIVGGFSYRIKYDIRSLHRHNYTTIRYVNKHYPNTFRNSLTQSCKSAISADECRKKIYKLNEHFCPPKEVKSINEHVSLPQGGPNGGYNIPLYAKGNRIESIWLLYPESCDGNFHRLPSRIKKIGEIDNFVPKYDSINNKYAILEENIHIIHKSNVSEKKLLNLQTDIDTHHSLYECIVFAAILIQKLKYE